jgi:hypothetical protein
LSRYSEGVSEMRLHQNAEKQRALARLKHHREIVAGVGSARE